MGNRFDNNISVYQVNTTTGVFTPISSSPFLAGTQPNFIAYSPEVNGNLFAAAVNQMTNNVSVYKVNPTTGVFTPVPGSPFSTGQNPFYIAYSPAIINGSGNLLFVALVNALANTVSVYQVDTATGALTELSDSPFATGANPSSVAYSPDMDGNLFAAVGNQSDDNISVYQVILPPNVISVNPSLGSISGETSVTISGTNFTGATTVDFGINPAISFTVDNATQITAISPPGTGTVDVTVTTPVATSATYPADQFTYFPPPTVKSVMPSTGPTLGGTIVTITGTNFTSVAGVNFGAVPALSFTVNSATKITAVSPPGVGTVDVTVTTSFGTSATSPVDQFTYVPPPTVTSIIPSSGSSTGGTSVTITGTDFISVTGVSFGAVPATSFTINSPTKMTAVSPPGTGIVDVVVTTSFGTSATSPADQFTYVSLPTVTSVIPSSGPSTGGTSVTISGTGFISVTGVSFGAVPAASFTVNSATQITAVSPPGIGTVDVTVTTPFGTSALSSADQFTYLSSITITSVIPSSGPSRGGTRVTITGTNFINVTGVKFGAIPAASFIVNSATQITAFSPPGTGTVDVTVTTSFGTSVISPADRFTYIGPPLPPAHVRGCQKPKNCEKDGIVILLKWQAPIDDASIIAYKIYRDKCLSKLAGVVLNNEPLKFKERRYTEKDVYVYFIVSVDKFGEISQPVKVKAKKLCHRECKANDLNLLKTNEN